MKNIMYVVFDRVAEEAGPIFTAKNDEVAQRQFGNMLSSEKVTTFQDFVLFKIGIYDSETMEVEPLPKSKIMDGDISIHEGEK